MTNLASYHSANLPELMKIISKNGIGMDDYLDRFFTNSYETTTNYPPYNLIHVNNVESVLEIALAGFSKSELNISVEDGNLVVKGEQEKSEDEFLHKGIAERNFTRTWALADDVKVTGSKLKDGVLTISLVHEIPEEKKPTSIEIK